MRYIPRPPIVRTVALEEEPKTRIPKETDFLHPITFSVKKHDFGVFLSGLPKTKEASPVFVYRRLGRTLSGAKEIPPLGRGDALKHNDLPTLVHYHTILLSVDKQFVQPLPTGCR